MFSKNRPRVVGSHAGFNNDLLDKFLDIAFYINKPCLNADGRLGTDLPQGKYFEDLQTQLENSMENGSKYKITKDTHPKTFFNQALLPVLSNSTQISYLDEYAFDHIAKGKHEFLRLLMQSAPKSTISIISGGTNVDNKRKILVEQIITELIDQVGFEGDISLSFSSWKKGRWLVLSLGGEKRLAIQFSFSLEYWSHSIFGIVQDIVFEKYQSNFKSESELWSFLVNHRNTSTLGKLHFREGEILQNF
jgi:hypothetical protein